jgi:L-aspartate oxidase
VPAAHYTCGGVVVDDMGRTDVRNLYAVGETACTGLHGANRMASNSLLECVVYGKRCAAAIAAHEGTTYDGKLPEWDASKVTDSDEAIVIHHNWHELRQFMWNYVGIVRSDKRLQRAKHRIDLLSREIAEFYGHHTITPDLIELRNLALVSELIIKSAMERKESRGLHYSLDHPHKLAKAVDTVLTPFT